WSRRGRGRSSPAPCMRRTRSSSPPGSCAGSEALARLEERLTRCRLCPRLVEHRERVAREKVTRFRDWTYWGRPVPRFGDPRARPTPLGIATCRRYLLGELGLLTRLRIVVALGKVAHDGFLAAERGRGRLVPRPAPSFAHGGEHRLPSGMVLLSSYHPSQQNTFTGKLTQPMLDRVFSRARTLLDA